MKTPEDRTFFFAIESSIDDRIEYCHADEATISRLSEVGGARISVYFGIDFIHSRQGVHHDAFLGQA